MGDSAPVALEIESATSMVEQLGKVFTELKSHEDASEKVQWKEIEEYFINLESSFKKKFDELEEKEKAFVEKESEAHALIAEREAAVAAKEQASLDLVQELKEAAVAAILEAREKYPPPSPDPVVGGNGESKVNTSLNGDSDAVFHAPEDGSPHRSGEQSITVEVEPRPELTQFCEQMDAKGLLNFIMENQNIFSAIQKEIPVALKVASEPARLVLDSLEGFYPPDQTNDKGNDQTTNEVNDQTTCEGNDQSTNEVNDQTTNQGDDQTTDEVNDQTTTEGNDQTMNEGNDQAPNEVNDKTTNEVKDQITNEVKKTDAALPGMRKSCVMLMESVAPLLVGADPEADDPLSPENKQKAKAIADEWKSRLVEVEIDAANGNSLEAEAFLQLLATFRIASEFDEEELCKLVLAIAHCRKTPELCRSLGLTHKVSGIVGNLINRGKQIDAVHFVQAFKLTEVFSPVTLLKTYLKDLRRNAQGKGVTSGSAAGAENDVNALELAAIKAVIKCVVEYKLEAEYPLDPLQKRQIQLEKSKTDKKRMGEGGKHHHQPKKPRANGGYYGSRMHVDRHPPAHGYGQVGGGYMGASERYPQAGPTAYSYQAPSQGVYGQQQDIGQRPYYYPQDGRAPAGAYGGGAPSTYGASYTGSGLPSSHPSYM